MDNGLLSWDVNECLVDLEKELAIIIEQGLEGEEARYGERLIQFASENLVTEILIHPAVSTLSQCVRNLLSSFTRHRHIIHAGYTFQGNGSWALQDGTFSYSDFAEAFQEIEVQRVIHAYENGISIDLHCAPEGDWTRLPKEYFTKACKVRVNPTDVLTTGSPSISSFIKYLDPFLVPTALEEILESSDVVGNIRFSRPTLYVFPGGQGDAALFGINGFNMLLDGGYSRKACFWDFVRHLDRLDAVLMSRLNNSSVSGVSSVLKRKKQGAVYPQIGHFFCNIQERKSLLSPDGDKDKDALIVSLLEEGQNIIQDLRHLNLNPQSCYRDQEPIILYHKVGHGTLNMYVLSPDKNSREVKEFLQKWNQSDPKLFAVTKTGKDFTFPLQNMVSICALLVWQPANPNDTITRILYPGSTPQKKIFEGLERIKNLEYMKHPVCTVKSIAPAKKPKSDVIEKLAVKETKLITDKKIEDALKNGEMNGDVVREKHVKKSDSVESEKEKKARIDDVKKADETKIIENGEKPRLKLKHEEPKPKTKGDNQQQQQRRKPTATADKRGPPTPKKTAENKTNGETKERKAPHKASPHATPAKSTKDANNRKVIEGKKVPSKKEAAPKPAPAAEAKPKTERKPISRRPKTVKGPPSPMKKMANGIQKVDSVPKRGKLDKEGTTDSSTVSTPSADQESILKKDISKLTPEEIQQMKEKELEELKEEQEAVKEIEAVFRKGETRTEESEPGVRKIKEMSIDDNLDTEEYLIIEKEEIEHDSLDQEAKEDEMQKLVRDSEESEKQRKLSAEEEKLKADVQPDDEVATTKISEPQVVSPEDKPISATDKKEMADEDVKEIVESHPEEKVSANIESGATTTAPTLPEDERITLDEIKEDNGQAIEEKHVKEETKEKEVPIIQLPPKSQQEGQLKQPQVVGIPLEKQKHIRDIVKTPDEVADLPVHEEADYHEYHGDEKKSNEVEAKDDKREKAKVVVDKETVAAKTDEILEKADVETKEKSDQEDRYFQEGKLKESIDEEWVVITKEDEDERAPPEKAEEASKIITKEEFEVVQAEEEPQPPKVDKKDELTTPPKTLDRDIDTESEQDTHEIRKEDEIEEIIEKDKEDIKALIEEADQKPLEDIIIEKDDSKEPPKVVDDKVIAIKEAKQEIAVIDTKLQQLKKDVTIPVEELKLDKAKQDLTKIEEPPKVDLKQELQQIAKIDDKLHELKTLTTEETVEKKDEITVEKSTRSPEHAEPVVLSDSSPEEDSSRILKDLDIDKSELGRKSPAEREEDVKKIVASVAEVLKSEAPLEEFQNKLPFTQELRETHITTQDSPILEAKIIKTDDIPPIPEEPAEEDAKPTATDKEPSPSPTEAEESPEDKTEKDDVTVHRMLVTASSEDGGEEIEICPAGTITFSKSSESSGRSSPEPSQKTHVDTLSESLSTVKRVSEEDSVIESKVSDSQVEKKIEEVGKAEEVVAKDKEEAAALAKVDDTEKVVEEIRPKEIKEDKKVDDKTKQMAETVKHEETKAEPAEKPVEDKATEKIEAEKFKGESAGELLEKAAVEKVLKDDDAHKTPEEQERGEDKAQKIPEKVEETPKTTAPSEIQDSMKVSEEKLPKDQQEEVGKDKPKDEPIEDQKLSKAATDEKDAPKEVDKKDLSDQEKPIEGKIASEDQIFSEKAEDISDATKKTIETTPPKDQKDLAKEEITGEPSEAKHVSVDQRIPDKIEEAAKASTDLDDSTKDKPVVDQKDSEKVQHVLEAATDLKAEDIKAADKVSEAKVEELSEKIEDIIKKPSEVKEETALTAEEGVVKPSDAIAPSEERRPSEIVTETPLEAKLRPPDQMDEKIKEKPPSDAKEPSEKFEETIEAKTGVEDQKPSEKIEAAGSEKDVSEADLKIKAEIELVSEALGKADKLSEKLVEDKVDSEKVEEIPKALKDEAEKTAEDTVAPEAQKISGKAIAEDKVAEGKMVSKDQKILDKLEDASEALKEETVKKPAEAIQDKVDSEKAKDKVAPEDQKFSEKAIAEDKISEGKLVSEDLRVLDKKPAEDEKLVEDKVDSEKTDEISKVDKDEAGKLAEDNVVLEDQKITEEKLAEKKVVPEDQKPTDKIADVSEVSKHEDKISQKPLEDKVGSEKAEEISKAHKEETEKPAEEKVVAEDKLDEKKVISEDQKSSSKIEDVSEAFKVESDKKPAEAVIISDKLVEDKVDSEKMEDISKAHKEETEKPAEEKVDSETQKIKEKGIAEDKEREDQKTSDKVEDVSEASKGESDKTPTQTDKIIEKLVEEKVDSEKAEEIAKVLKGEAEKPVEDKLAPETQKSSEKAIVDDKVAKDIVVSEDKEITEKADKVSEKLVEDKMDSEKVGKISKAHKDEVEKSAEDKVVPEHDTEDREILAKAGDGSEASKDELVKKPAETDKVDSEKIEDISKTHKDEAEKPVGDSLAPEAHKASGKIEDISKAIEEDKLAEDKVVSETDTSKKDGDISEATEEESIKKPSEVVKPSEQLVEDKMSSEKVEEISKVHKDEADDKVASEIQKASEKAEDVSKVIAEDKLAEDKVISEDQKISEKIADGSEAPKDESVKKPAEDTILAEDQKALEKTEHTEAATKEELPEKPVGDQKASEKVAEDELVKKATKDQKASDKIEDAFKAPTTASVDEKSAEDQKQPAKEPVEDKFLTDDKKESEKTEALSEAPKVELVEKATEDQKASEKIAVGLPTKGEAKTEDETQGPSEKGLITRDETDEKPCELKPVVKDESAEKPSDVKTKVDSETDGEQKTKALVEQPGKEIKDSISEKPSKAKEDLAVQKDLEKAGAVPDKSLESSASPQKDVEKATVEHKTEETTPEAAKEKLDAAGKLLESSQLEAEEKPSEDKKLFDTGKTETVEKVPQLAEGAVPVEAEEESTTDQKAPAVEKLEAVTKISESIEEAAPIEGERKATADEKVPAVQKIDAVRKTSESAEGAAPAEAEEGLAKDKTVSADSTTSRIEVEEKLVEPEAATYEKDVKKDERVPELSKDESKVEMKKVQEETKDTAQPFEDKAVSLVEKEPLISKLVETEDKSLKTEDVADGATAEKMKAHDTSLKKPLEGEDKAPVTEDKTCPAEHRASEKPSEVKKISEDKVVAEDKPSVPEVKKEEEPVAVKEVSKTEASAAKEPHEDEVKIAPHEEKEQPQRRDSIIDKAQEFIEKPVEALQDVLTTIGSKAHSVLDEIINKEPDSETKEDVDGEGSKPEDKKEDSPQRRGSIIEAAEEFIDKSGKTVESLFTAIEGSAKSVLDSIWGDKKDEVEEKGQFSDEFKVDKDTIEKEKKQIEEETDQLRRGYEDLSKLNESVSFEKCHPPEDFKVGKETIEKEEKEIEKKVMHVSESVDKVSDLADSISFDKCHLPDKKEIKTDEEFKLDHETLKKEEKQIEEEADALKRSYEDLTKLTESASFEKCHPPEEYKVDKEIIQKEEKQIEDRVRHLSESFDEVSHLAKTVSFEKCHPPKESEAGHSGEYKVDKDAAEQEKKVVFDVGKEIVEAKGKESDEEKAARIEKQMEAHVAHVAERAEEISELAKSLAFEKCPPPPQEPKPETDSSPKSTVSSDEFKVDKDAAEKEKEHSDEKLSDKQETETKSSKHDDVEKDISKIKEGPSLAGGEAPIDSNRLEHLSQHMKEDKEAPKDVSASKDPVALDHQALPSQTEKCEKESMEKTSCPIKDLTSLKVDHADQKKISISDVEISIKTEIDHKDAIQSFLDNERSAVCDTTDAKIFRPSPEDLAASRDGASTVDLKTPTEAGASSDKSSPEVELSGKATPPTVPMSPVAQEVKSPSSKLDSGLSEQTETDEEDLSTKSQVAHSQSDLDELDAKMDPMSMSFYGALPEEQPEPKEVAPTYLYEITKAKYGSDIKLDEEEGAMKEDEMNLMTASFIGELPSSSSTSRTTATTQEKPEKDAVDSWGKPLSLPAPTYLYEVTKARFSTKSDETDLMTSSFIGEELPSSNKPEQKEQDPMTTSVYFGDSPDPIASWGKPLGLPSPAPPNNNEKGTPKKEKKLPAYVSAKNKLNDDKKRAESPSKIRAKKVNPVYVDLTYVPHHGNHNYCYVDFFKKIRARYYVFSGLEPSRQVYDALLEAKQTWEDKELEVTIIPTYDTDILGYWVAENEELLSRFKIDLAPSASRCTINLQDHETSCSAYRLEF